MRLLVKFSVIFAIVFGVGIAIAGFLSYRRLQDDARTEVRDQARLMMEAMSSVRNYTNLQVKPLLTQVQDSRKTFLPQTVPAYAATENFGYLRVRFPDYSYKEAALNPTNSRDRALDWEADIISSFRNSPGLQQLTGERDAATGPSLFFAQPIRAAAPCLVFVNSEPDKAPAALLTSYGSANGFGWKKDDVVAAQIIRRPWRFRYGRRGIRSANCWPISWQSFWSALVVLDLTRYFNDRASGRLRLSESPDSDQLGQQDVAELPVKGRDEIAQLAGSFNRMT